MPKASTKQIIAFKTSLDKIYKRSIELGVGMTKEEIEREVKINAGFPFESTKDENVTTDDMTNLIIWTDLYSDQFGLSNDFPSSELDKQINLNIK